MKKTITEQTHDTCTLCGGSGQEYSRGESTSTMSTCRKCHGSGQMLVRTVTRTEDFDIDELADALARRIPQAIKG